MEAPEEVWMIAGTEPGTKRFGHLIQSLRKEQQMSVDGVATAVKLSPSTIRAIEQGRRAPSEQSGVRLLEYLLPAESGLTTPDTDSGNRTAFRDPSTGNQVELIFGAKKQGDNRRWTSDGDRAAATAAEAALAHVLQDPAWARSVKTGLEPLVGQLESLRQRAKQPPSDASLGRAIRSMTQLNALRVLELRSLMRMWLAVDSGEADTDVQEAVEAVGDALRRLTYLDEDWF